MTAPVLAKTCPARVRDGGKMVPCDQQLTRGLCSNRGVHVNPIVTGFCNSEWHEGLKINKPTCKYWMTCPCDCHTKISAMYALTGDDRPMIDNSTYLPERASFVRVSLTEAATERAVTQTKGRIIVSQAPGIVPDFLERDFAPTETGRAARGQLESWVRRVTDIWVTEMPENCTPKYVGQCIMDLEGLDKPPSQGAVDSVFRRWQQIGFAVIGERPTRFTRYTIEGIRDGLEAMKARAKK